MVENFCASLVASIETHPAAQEEEYPLVWVEDAYFVGIVGWVAHRVADVANPPVEYRPHPFAVHE